MLKFTLALACVTCVPYFGCAKIEGGHFPPPLLMFSLTYSVLFSAVELNVPVVALADRVEIID